MKIVIDEKMCHKHKMTLTEVLVVLAIRNGLDGNEISNMLNREILVEGKSEWYLVTQHWSDVVDEILCDSSNSKDITDERLMKLAVEIQQCFPATRMLDRYGRPTPYYYRCNKGEIAAKLKKFFLKFGNYSDEEIIDATKRYVASFNGNYSGMRLAKYFIWKDDHKAQEDESIKIESISDLATFLENKESEDDVVTGNGDWTSKMI